MDHNYIVYDYGVLLNSAYLVVMEIASYHCILFHRQRAEAKVTQLREEISKASEVHEKKVEALISQLNEAKSRGIRLAEQLTALERTNSHLDVDLGTAQRHLDAANEDNLRLKEEVCLVTV